jgi:hypothetical protein
MKDKHAVLRVPAVFILVCLAWVFFRAESLPDAVLILRKFTTLPAELVEYARRLPGTGLISSVRSAFSLGSTTNFGIKACGLSFVFIGVLLAVSSQTRERAGTEVVKAFPPAVRWAGYYALVLVILLGRPVEASRFIYFTF